jgi:hypothetical protein
MCIMAKKGDELKKRAETYEKSTLKINGNFDDVIKAAFLGKPKSKPGDELKALIEDKKNEASK